MSDAHITSKIWDAVLGVAVDGSIEGTVSVQPNGETGTHVFDVPDGGRFRVTVERIGEARLAAPRSDE